MKRVNVTTVGFTKSNAEQFFERLINSGVKTVVDVRLHNTSQLSGFAKASDLAYFLRKIGGIEYIHQPVLAPTDEILRAYKKDKGDWSVYQNRFLQLMEERRIEQFLKPENLEGACLLCSEATPHNCHRRLIVEYLNDKWGNVLAVRHL
jgi:uncharacterized protein (DUF488 family)